MHDEPRRFPHSCESRKSVAGGVHTQVHSTRSAFGSRPPPLPAARCLRPCWGVLLLALLRCRVPRAVLLRRCCAAAAPRACRPRGSRLPPLLPPGGSAASTAAPFTAVLLPYYLNDSYEYELVAPVRVCTPCLVLTHVFSPYS